MYGCVRRAKLDNLRTNRCNESAITRAAASGEIGCDTGFVADRFLNRPHQAPWLRQERQSTDNPFQSVLDSVLIEDGRQTLLQIRGRGFRAEAEIKIHNAFAGNDVACSRSGVDVADLP